MNLISLAIALLLVANGPALAGQTMDVLNGGWRDDFRDLSGLDTNQQGIILAPSGFTVDSALQTYSQPSSTFGFSELFSSAGSSMDKTVVMTNAGTTGEHLSLWWRIWEPKDNGDMEYAYACAIGGGPKSFCPGMPTSPNTIQNGTSPDWGAVTHIPDQGWKSFGTVGWDTDASLTCLGSSTASPITGSIGQFEGQRLLYGATEKNIQKGFGYSATFLMNAKQGWHDTHMVPYLLFQFYDNNAKRSYASTTLYERDMLPGGTAMSREAEQMTPVTIRMPSAPAKSSWDFQAWSLTGPMPVGHAHCTYIGPVLVTADRGVFTSRQLDTFSDNTVWHEISWALQMATGYKDTTYGCIYQDHPKSAIPVGAPLAPVRLKYEVGNSATIAGYEGTVWHGGEGVSGYIGMNMVNASSAPMVDGTGGLLKGRYFRFSAELFSRAAADELDPDLYPANGLAADGLPYPPWICNGALRPIVRRITVSYFVCTARAVSKAIMPPSVAGWKSAECTIEIPSTGASVFIDILSSNGALLATKLVSGDSGGTGIRNESIPLTGVEPRANPGIILRATLYSDPVACSRRPIIQSWGVKWDPLVDVIAVGCNAIRPALGESCPMQVKVDKAGRVRVVVHDVAGQQVRKLVDEDMPARALFLSWDGRNDRGEVAATGVYFVSAAVPGGKTRVRRLAVAR
jgi:hypothetical protein